mgnify:CR=1 FL=1|tara:strand:- start:5458 stop:5829 length:372 start_codon:yes stop_codon:yes gene_type:complete
MAHYEDISIDQGTDVSIELHLQNKDKSVKDLTNFSVAAWLKPNYAADSSEKIAFTGIVASPATDGIVNLSLTNLQTDVLNPKKRYVYDVELSYVSDSDGSGNLTYIIERILEGYVSVTPSVTR